MYVEPDLALCAVVLAAVVLPAAAGGEASRSDRKLCKRLMTRLLSAGLDRQSGKVKIDRGSGPERLAYFSVPPRSPEASPRPPILLLHGFTAEKEDWLPMVRVLCRSHRVVALDLAGHGDSPDAADGDYGLAAQADRAHRLAAELELGRYHVLAHSMGGGVAIALALAHSDKVLSLGLVAPAAREHPHTDEFHELLDGRNPDKPGDLINPLIVDEHWSHRERARYVANGPRWLRWGCRFHSCLSQPNASRTEVYTEIFRQLTEDGPKPPFTDAELASIRQPTFILWGTDDRVLEPSLDYYQKRLGGAVTTELPGVGHAPIIEAVEETAGRYLEFLKGLGESAKD